MKSFKAKGKRLTTYETAAITELEPLRRPEPGSEGEDTAVQADGVEDAPENLDPDAGKSRADILDEIAGQMKLFEDE